MQLRKDKIFNSFSKLPWFYPGSFFILNGRFNKSEVIMRTLLLLLFIPIIISAQNSFEESLNRSFTNAKKGIYYALSNIPERKNSLSRDLIDNDALIAKVKLSKEVKGVHVEATGFYNSYEIKISAYRSYENLKKEGLIDYIPPEN